MVVLFSRSWSRFAPTVDGTVLVLTHRCRNASGPSSLMFANRRAFWTASMIETAAALSAGAGVVVAILIVSAPASQPVLPPWISRAIARRWAREVNLSVGTGWGWLDGSRLAACECFAAVVAAMTAAAMTGLVVLAAPAAVGGASAVRAVVSARLRAQQVVRQDAVLEATRMLRQLLETGAPTVNQAVAVLAERGPIPLRREFRLIA